MLNNEFDEIVLPAIQKSIFEAYMALREHPDYLELFEQGHEEFKQVIVRFADDIHNACKNIDR